MREADLLVELLLHVVVRVPLTRDSRKDFTMHVVVRVPLTHRKDFTLFILVYMGHPFFGSSQIRGVLKYRPTLDSKLAAPLLHVTSGQKT